MYRIRILVSLITAGVVLYGCAGTKLVNIPQPWCTLGGTLIGAGAGVGLNEVVADKGEEENTRAEGAAAGAAFGAALSFILCGGDEPAKPAAAPVSAPAPAPAPDRCALDEDRDGVNDCDDRCPSTPAGVAVDSSGCPKAGETLLRLEGINFAFDSAKLTPEAGQILDQAVQELRDAASVSVRVEGHTDSKGSERYNLKLSQRRSEAVVEYLVSQGIARERLEPVGMGEGHPIDSNKTEEGRYHNRRVEFVVAK